VNDHWSEAEQRAAFLDQRLSECERTKMITRLAEDDDAYELLTRTVLVLSDALLERMQTPEVRAATRRAFNASPDELRKAAMEAARSSEG
jgi:hypothetical protein